MHRYAQIDITSGIVIGDSHLSGRVDRPNLIPIPDGFDLNNKKYINGDWESYEPVLPEQVHEPTEQEQQEQINAEILLNQATIIANQNNAEEVMAEILLNQVGG